jgi:hypothetical protein
MAGNGFILTGSCKASSAQAWVESGPAVSAQLLDLGFGKATQPVADDYAC